MVDVCARNLGGRTVLGVLVFRWAAPHHCSKEHTLVLQYLVCRCSIIVLSSPPLKFNDLLYPPVRHLSQDYRADRFLLE